MNTLVIIPQRKVALVQEYIDMTENSCSCLFICFRTYRVQKGQHDASPYLDRHEMIMPRLSTNRE